jgi:hypothetical protein
MNPQAQATLNQHILDILGGIVPRAKSMPLAPAYAAGQVPNFAAPPQIDPTAPTNPATIAKLNTPIKPSPVPGYLQTIRIYSRERQPLSS